MVHPVGAEAEHQRQLCAQGGGEDGSRGSLEPGPLREDPSPAAARIPILFPSSGPPLPAWLGAQARGRDGRCEEEKGGVAVPP